MYKSLNDAALFCSGLAPGAVKIWYQRPEVFGKFAFDQSGLNPNKLEETHVLLGEVAEYKLEKLFELLQGENWSPNGEARELIRSKGLAHTSMSVGDVVQERDATYVCASVGWKQLSHA